MEEHLNSERFLYEKESRLIYDACYEVWKKFGGAYKESVVDKALTIALQKRNLSVETQKRIKLLFDGVEVGVYIPDKVINNIIILEVKCKPYIIKEDERQFWYYLRATEYRLGFLVNFGTKQLEIKRRIYDKARKKSVA